MIERYLSILEVSQKQAYIFGSNKLADNVQRSAEIRWLTDPAEIQALINDKSCMDCEKNVVYAGGGHTVLVFESYDKAVEFNRRYTFIMRTMNPELELFVFTLPCCSKVSAGSMLEYVYANHSRSQEEDEKFAKERASSGHGDPRECTPSMYLKALVSGLERKKSLRRASFRQGSFGVEEIDSGTRSVKHRKTAGNASAQSASPAFFRRSNYDGIPCSAGEQTDEAEAFEALKTAGRKADGSNPVPEGFAAASKFEDLGGTKGDTNLLAVVHIDGNGMGARCNQFYEKLSRGYADGQGGDEERRWVRFRDAVNEFSQAIDKDFKKALSKMYERVGVSLKEGKLQNLALKAEKRTEKTYFPIRGIIASGDDICFVTDGRIGIECAAIFLEELGKLTNSKDGKAYSASAGVAIVHQKYPFFRAYELAERLCSNAKEFAADIRSAQAKAFCENQKSAVPEALTDNGAGICAIDWHLELGEIGMSLDEIRSTYLTKSIIGAGQKHLEMRPYIVAVKSDAEAPYDVKTIEPHRQYSAFRRQMELYKRAGGGAESDEFNARLKELRGIVKEGEVKTQYYIQFHKIKGLILDSYYGIFKDVGFREDAEKIPVFVKTADGQERSIIFDAAELIGTYMIL